MTILVDSVLGGSFIFLSLLIGVFIVPLFLFGFGTILQIWFYENRKVTFPIYFSVWFLCIFIVWYFFIPPA